MPSAKASKKRVNFLLHAPGAREVYVAGSFNDWDPTARPLKRGKDDEWRTWMNLAPGTHEYQFVVDGEWREDPSCSERRPSPYGSHNSVVEL